MNELSRALQKELLARAGAAASAGNAAETERWLANADGAGAARPDMTAIRVLLQQTVNGARTDKISALVQSFNAALAANKLLQPAQGSAKSFLLALIDIDANSPAVVTARQGLGNAYLRELRGALTRGDVDAGDAWLLEAKTISFNGAELNAAESDLTALREQSSQRDSVISASEMERTVYVAPKYPVAAARSHTMNGWVELEFTVKTDGTTASIVVTNSSPRRVFDAAAMAAVAQWQYKPMMQRGKTVEQRVAVRIRFMEE